MRGMKCQMNHEIKDKTGEATNKLKQHIESNEIIFMTELLDARRKVAKKIEKTREIAKQEYQAELEKNEEEKKNLIAKAKENFDMLLNDIEKVEEEINQEIKNNYKQREKEVIDELLKIILP